MQVSLHWKELAGAFRVTSVLGIVGGSYLAYAVPPWLVIGWLFSPGLGSGFPTESYSLLILSLYFFLLTVSIGGALSLLMLPLNDDQRGILSLFVIVCAFVPMVFLWFEALYWILQFWQFAVVGFVWAGLMLITMRTVHPSKVKGSRV